MNIVTWEIDEIEKLERWYWELPLQQIRKAKWDRLAIREAYETGGAASEEGGRKCLTPGEFALKGP